MVATNSTPYARIARVFALACAALAPVAQAGMLYKSIGANGVIQFSDTPPANGVVVEQRVVGAAPIETMTAAGNPLVTLDASNADDAELARANEKVDLAEHALALARHAFDADPARMRLASANRTRTDDDRVAFFEHDLKLARNNLLEMLKSRRATLATAAAEPGAPQFGPLRKIASR